MTIQQIPLSKLVPSPANVRRTGAATGIEELAASIKAHGLLQNLQVRATNHGRFEVVAGRRRLAALKLLARSKALRRIVEIPCHVLDEGEDATEISLAENVVRLPMHPADQFEAFKALSDAGRGPEDIAARFGCAPSTVRQRLRLAAVSPALMEAYRAEEMNLDQLTAFTVSDDHAAQEKVWRELAGWNRHPDAIRRALTQGHVEADDPRALFVGMDAYVAAGGAVLRDLFDEKHQGYLTDPALLDRLARERLEGEAEAVRREGWKWLEILPDIDYAALRNFGRIPCETPPLAPEQQAELDRLSATYDTLAEEYGDDAPEEIRAEMQALADQCAALPGDAYWEPEDIARAGAIVSIGREGKVTIERGLVRPEDMGDAKAAGRSAGGEEPGKAKTAKRGAGELSAALVQDLTAQRTAALRASLAGDPNTALAAVVHALALPLFYGFASPQSCLSLRLDSPGLRASSDGIEDSPAARKLTECEAYWRERLPEDAQGLFAWCLAQDNRTKHGLLAYCAACSVDAVAKPNERRDERLAHSDQLANALSLDMAQWWQPTAASYLARVTKARILEAVSEGVSPAAAENLANLKRDALIERAEERLAGKGWLPAPLRPPVKAAEAAPETLAA